MDLGVKILGLVVAIFIVSYMIFTNKRYDNFKKINDRKQITYLVEFFLITLLFWLSISSLLVLFSVYINSVNIVIFVIGLIIGSVLVKVISRYYLHEGLLFLGALMALCVMFIFLIQDNPSENRWITFIFGIAGSLLLLPLYGRVLTTFSKRTTVVITIVLIAVLFIFITIQETIFPSNTEKMHYLYSTIFGVLSIAVVLYLLFAYRGMMVWLCIEWTIKLRYKIVYEGIEYLSDDSALLFISNHISWIDWAVIQLPVKRRIHYMVNKNIYYKWYFNPFVRINECIPISRNSFRDGIRQARKLLKKKHAIGMFPEGSISKTGELGQFYRGIEFLNGPYDGKIVPVYIDGLWGSVLSRSKKKFCIKKSGFRRVIQVRFGPLLPLHTQALEVKQVIEKMQDENILKR